MSRCLDDLAFAQIVIAHAFIRSLNFPTWLESNGKWGNWITDGQSEVAIDNAIFLLEFHGEYGSFQEIEEATNIRHVIRVMRNNKGTRDYKDTKEQERDKIQKHSIKMAKILTRTKK